MARATAARLAVVGSFNVSLGASVSVSQSSPRTRVDAPQDVVREQSSGCTDEQKSFSSGLLLCRGQIQQTKWHPGQERPKEIERHDRTIGRSRPTLVPRQFTCSALVRSISAKVDNCCRHVYHSTSL